MNRKRLIGIGATAVGCVILAATGIFLETDRKAYIMDSDSQIIAELSYNKEGLAYQCEEEYKTYVEMACQETMQIIEEQEGIDQKKAEKYIVQKGMRIQTAFHVEAMKAIITAYEKNDSIRGKTPAAALSDVNGHMIACYSDSADNKNYLVYPTYAGSTLKPFSVYAPALEEGIIDWSTMYMDSPYMEIENKDGMVAGWPTNTEPYSNHEITVEEALRKSNNAVAVKVLKDVGVEKSCELLATELHMNVQGEKEKIQKEGEDTVLSNIALGYLQAGVTVEKMLENYQVFANGGICYPLHVVTKIDNKKNEMYYQETEEGRQIFSEETAFIVNRLLNKVVDEGTGTNAQIEDIDICGKTGTSTDYRDNWFIGMTPEYVCGVWYSDKGAVMHQNESLTVFRDIMLHLKHDSSKTYPFAEGVVKKQYCEKSGCLNNGNCEQVRAGYYNKKYLPVLCDCP